MSGGPLTISDFTILRISMPATEAFPTSATHHVYIRPNTPKIPTPQDSRSLFLVNVPIDSTELHWRAVFASLVGAGKFESITFENENLKPPVPSDSVQDIGGSKKRKRGAGRDGTATPAELPKIWDRELRRSGSSAVVVLADAKSVEVVMKAIRKSHRSGSYPVWGSGVDAEKIPPLGSQRYFTHHLMTYPDKNELQASVDAYMMSFNRKEEQAAELAKRQRNIPDDDGFITVTRGGRTGPARQHDAETARKKQLAKEEAKKKSMSDFYRFQGRERRKAEQAELVKQFEEDRKRVQELKEKRGRLRPES